jgi:hypothetical protein
MNEYPCKTCTYRDTPYVCEQQTCDKYERYMQSQKAISLYEELGEIAKQTVIRTMIEGEKEHGVDGWKHKSVEYHKQHALEHAEKAYSCVPTKEDDVGHCMTRCAQIKYLEKG